MKEEQKALKPRLRFPEFRDAGEWEEKPIGKVCTVLQGYGFPTAMQGKENGKYPFCKVSDISRAVAEQGGLLADATNYVDDVDVSKLRAKLIPLGSTVFAKIGEALRLNRRAFVQRECLLDNNAVGLKAIDGVVNDYFIYLLSQLIDLNEHCGGAVPSVNKSNLEAIEVVLPGSDEQQKIADCLSSLDVLISAHTKKLDALKTHKKGLMQQLFPREGETVPRLRFSEFLDAGEWEVNTMGSLASFSSGGTPSKSNLEFWNGNIPWISASSMYDLVVENADHYVTPLAIGNGTRIAKKGSILVLVRGSMLFKRVPICIAGTDVAFNQDVKALEVKATIDTEFLLHQLLAFQSRIHINETGIGAGKIELEHLKSFKIFVPDAAEQRCIANFLNSLDALITAHTKKLDVLKSHKKGLMQQLFPSPEAVEA